MDQVPTEMPAKPRLVVVAVSASARTGASVPRIGFRLAREMSEMVGAMLVLHSRDRENVAGMLPEDRVHFAGSRRLAHTLRQVGARLFPEKWTLISIVEFLDYVVFDLQAYRAVRRMIRAGEVDAVLRLNPISFRHPSLLSRLPVPVFTGPHNGGMSWPPGFEFLESAERTGSRFRVLADIGHALLGDTKHYAGIFVAHELCAETVPHRYRDRVVLLSENGVDGVASTSRHAGDARRLLFVGRLTPVKAVDLAIRALARLPEQVQLTIVGDGPSRAGLEQLADSLGVRERCTFAGQQPHEALHRFYGDAGVFVFPSVRESGGAVVLEAMAHGLPCLVADWGGPAVFTRDTGIRMRVSSPHDLEQDLVHTVEHLLEHPEIGREIGERSRRLVRDEYAWASKAELILQHIQRMGPSAAGR